MSTTGTGASGEMRVTSPQRNSSSITSPSTTTLRSLTLPSSSAARCLSIVVMNSGWNDIDGTSRSIRPDAFLTLGVDLDYYIPRRWRLSLDNLGDKLLTFFN